MQARLLFAVVLSTLVATVSTVSAAPIQGILNAGTGNVVVNGFTGEIFIALRGPASSLLPENALPGDQSRTLELRPPGDEIAYLSLGGINGSLNFGNVVKPG